MQRIDDKSFIGAKQCVIKATPKVGWHFNSTQFVEEEVHLHIFRLYLNFSNRIKMILWSNRELSNSWAFQMQNRLLSDSLSDLFLPRLSHLYPLIHDYRICNLNSIHESRLSWWIFASLFPFTIISLYILKLPDLLPLCR